jgi:cytochrome P450
MQTYLKTHVALRIFLLLISSHPHVAKRAQQELDELLGGERLPEYSDRPNLPYVDCILKEVLRYVLLFSSILKTIDTLSC